MTAICISQNTSYCFFKEAYGCFMGGKKAQQWIFKQQTINYTKGIVENAMKYIGQLYSNVYNTYASSN